jgi:hypothetical protein
MISFFKNLVTSERKGKLSLTGEPFSDKKYRHCDIEHFPHSGRYFPRYKGYYLFWWNTKQVYSLETDMSCCEYSESVDGAIQILNNFLNLQNINSEIIKLS